MKDNKRVMMQFDELCAKKIFNNCQVLQPLGLKTFILDFKALN